MLSPLFVPFPEIKTERLLLRALTLQDAPRVQQLRSNKEVMQYINRPLTKTVQEAESWIQLIMDALCKGDGITWCICLKEAPENHIGSIGLWRIDKENYRAEIGYMLDPSMQQKGIMHEALQQVLEYGFREMGLHSVEAHIDPANVASAALLQKTGSVQEAYFKESYYWMGQFGDSAVYSILTPYKQAAETVNKEQETNFQA